MSEIFGSDWTRRDLLRRVGDASQLAGIRRATLLDGRERGVKVFGFRTGGGLNFTVVPSRGMDIANASLLDEATAAAEAMALLQRASRGSGDTFLVDLDCHPQVLEVVRTRARPLGLTVHVADPWSDDIPDGTFGALLQYPGSSGRIRDLGPAVTRLRTAGVGIAVATDLLACCLIAAPGDHYVDVVIG